MQRKLLMINAMYSNSAYDESKVNRQPLIAQIEGSFEEAVNAIYGFKPPELDLSQNPFFAAIRIPSIPPEALAEEEARQLAGSLVKPDDVVIDQLVD